MSRVERRTIRTGFALEPLLPGRLAQGIVIGARKSRVFPGAHVAQVADDIHDLVVAEQDMHGTARGARLALEPHEQVEHAPRVGPAVDEVAEADEVGVRTAPAQRAVHDALGTKQRNQLVEGAVNVRENHHAARALDAPGRVTRGCNRQQAGPREPEAREHRGEEVPAPAGVTAHGAYHARVTATAERSRMTTLAGKMMLQRSPLFRGLAPATLERIAALATQRGYRRGEIVFSHGDPGRCAVRVVTGRIRISTGSADGREIFLNIMEPGDTFGEIALLDGGTRTATATAIAPPSSSRSAANRCSSCSSASRRPRSSCCGCAGERLRWTSGLLEDAALLDAPARLAKRLLSLGELHGEDGADGRQVRISQEDLASFLGVSRQAVNEQLQDWKAKGWVGLGRGTVTVRDAAALRSAIERR